MGDNQGIDAYGHGFLKDLITFYKEVYTLYSFI